MVFVSDAVFHLLTRVAACLAITDASSMDKYGSFMEFQAVKHLLLGVTQLLSVSGVWRRSYNVDVLNANKEEYFRAFKKFSI